MEDVQLARETGTDEVVKLVDQNGAIIISQDNKRYAVLISNQGPNDVTLSFVKVPIAGQGHILKVGTVFPPLDLQHHGDFLTGPICAICAAAQTATVCVSISSLERT